MSTQPYEMLRWSRDLALTRGAPSLTPHLAARDHPPAVRFTFILPLLLPLAAVAASCSATNPPSHGTGGTGGTCEPIPK